MAAGSGDCVPGRSTRLIALAENLRCQVCLEIYNSPRVLQCMHTFCEACIQGIVNSNTSRQIICPICRQSTKPTARTRNEWASSLPRNFALEPLIEHFKNARPPAETPSDIAEECRAIEYCYSHRDSRVDQYCREHASLLCSKCKQRHHNCAIAKLTDIVTNGNNSDQTKELHQQIQKMQHALAEVTSTLKTNVDEVQNTTDGFPSRIDALEKDLVKMFRQLRCTLNQNREENKKRLTKTQTEQIEHCVNLNVALSESFNELDRISKYGTSTQHFIANERLHHHLPFYESNVTGAKTFMHCIKIRQEGIAVMESVVKMGNELLNINQRKYEPESQNNQC